MKHLVIKNLDTGEVVRTIDVTGKSEGHVERALRGILLNMDTNNWYVDEVDS